MRRVPLIVLGLLLMGCTITRETRPGYFSTPQDCQHSVPMIPFLQGSAGIYSDRIDPQTGLPVCPLVGQFRIGY